MAFSADPFTFIASEFPVVVQLSNDCASCVSDKGICRLNSTGEFYCLKERRAWKLGLLIGVPSGTVVIIIGLVVILLRNKRRHKSLGSQNQSRTIESDNAHSNVILEGRHIYFKFPVFSYEELEEATNKFDQSRELGSGGFGTVYYGKLKDGREVAVKRLFERNSCVQQFMNEVKILTRLRHKNLVSLYGCTSRTSRELLLVYEYIPNGTLGCHLHGNLAKPSSLSWPLRMRIAIETANALSYLHASGIVHRDVKSSNLLLDHHFCVKVADFGISRLFPMFVSHVSTAPAGSPGYLDPEYYQFCELTEKSDVYSFGVVLIELISSKPAIIVTRAKDKISLANMAVKKIQRRAFTELIDPSLCFESDDKVKEMIISVANLAFQCLQRDGELRPSMDKVVEFLQKIENGKDDYLKHLEFRGAGFSNWEIHTSLPTSLLLDGTRSLNDSMPQLPPRTV
ncbi:LEAF RUST 10 DISEASE-RESISTANCE LOCUS RECEPTOR-LIKE PROTEIN KINASE-like 1.2 [Neltuma alba]|uniref:LEAF RUST 10 DISEASE-RESISTANCE LOCUS RECEPTOR-LIKE PROTEIN KINASE-like 1.2 n=1 Tax=Neltuma alba TaxID=207710 RepID=UPI0010A46C7A|nr:LEAF RUST 10 DISEASE-RESISTANCE LOCUS RECEPTOR-LIKE PROTEIN KINASE-like 1.2 [Prosopis alba]